MTELSGGAKINRIFHERFPFELVKVSEIAPKIIMRHPYDQKLKEVKLVNCYIVLRLLSCFTCKYLALKDQSILFSNIR